MNILKLNHKANELYSKDNFIGALDLYKKMLPKASFNDLPIVYYNIGLCHFSLYNYIAAEKSLVKSFELGYKSSGYELSMTKLFLNKLEEGLNLYNYRYYGERYKFPKLPIKMAKKYEDLIGKKILVLNEQGFGDELLFSRSIEMLSNICEYSKYQIYEELKDIFVENFSKQNIHFFTERSFNTDFVNQFDYWIPSGDLFTLHTIRNGFKHAKIPLTEHINDNTLGICWEANKLSPNTNLRSINIDELEYLKRYKIYSLQKDISKEWMLKEPIDNFKDTLNIISKCDVILSIDTSVLHLSALTNKKKYLLHKDYVDWRWNYPFYDNLEKINLNLGKIRLD